MPKAAAIGTFDGVHLGHTVVLATLRSAASERGLDPVAITFDRHPLALIAPQRAPKSITSIAKKEDIILKNGVKPFVLTFDESLRSTTAKEWMRTLKNKFDVKLLVVGYDNTFGSDGANLSISDYRDYGRELGIDVVEAPLVPGISSSAIRKAIAAGNVQGANDMLGRHFMLEGTVVKGNQLGRTIGFPTANITPDPEIITPARGVYAGTVLLPNGVKMPAMINIGVRPTIRNGNLQTTEAHVIGWNGDLYGKNISLFLYTRLRDELQFKSIDALRSQLEKDKANVLDAVRSKRHDAS